MENVQVQRVWPKINKMSFFLSVLVCKVLCHRFFIILFYFIVLFFCFSSFFLSSFLKVGWLSIYVVCGNLLCTDISHNFPVVNVVAIPSFTLM